MSIECACFLIVICNDYTIMTYDTTNTTPVGDAAINKFVEQTKIIWLDQPFFAMQLVLSDKKMPMSNTFSVFGLSESVIFKCLNELGRYVEKWNTSVITFNVLSFLVFFCRSYAV